LKVATLASVPHTTGNGWPPTTTHCWHEVLLLVNVGNIRVLCSLADDLEEM
jgi:hypothetical protein